MERDFLTLDEALLRINSQYSTAKKKKLATATINNNFSMKYTAKQLQSAWETITNEKIQIQSQ